jgi:LacI family transcriptional regulator
MAPATRERVLAAIEELGYMPDLTARSLRLKRTNTITVFVPDIVNPFFGLLLTGAQDEALQAGYDLLIYHTGGHRELERKALQLALSGRADAMIGVPYDLERADLKPLTLRGIPTAMLARASELDPDRTSGIDLVDVPSEAAAVMLVEHLVARGHTRIAIINGRAGTPPQINRENGYRQVLLRHGIPIDEGLIYNGDFDESTGYTRMVEVLARPDRPTAVFAATDSIAIGAMIASREAGVRIPEQIAIGGIDDIPAARLVSPALTTVNQHHDQLGRELVRLVLSRLHDPHPGPGRTVTGRFDLMVREST